jgi:hypothetical protein
MIGAGFEFAFGVFLFIAVLAICAAAFKTVTESIRHFLDGPTGKKLDAICRRHPWSTGITTTIVILGLIMWRLLTWRFVQ